MFLNGMLSENDLQVENIELFNSKKKQYILPRDVEIYQETTLTGILEHGIKISNNGLFITIFCIVLMFIQILLMLNCRSFMLQILKQISIFGINEKSNTMTFLFFSDTAMILISIIFYIYAYKFAALFYSKSHSEYIKDYITFLFDNLDPSIIKFVTYDKQKLLIHDLKKLMNYLYNIELYYIIAIVMFIIFFIIIICKPWIIKGINWLSTKIANKKLIDNNNIFTLLTLNFVPHHLNASQSYAYIDIVNLCISFLVIYIIYIFAKTSLYESINKAVAKKPVSITNNFMDNVTMLFNNLNLFILTNSFHKTLFNIRYKSNPDELQLHPNSNILLIAILLILFILILAISYGINHILSIDSIKNALFSLENFNQEEDDLRNIKVEEKKLHIFKTSITFISHVLLFYVICYMFINYNDIIETAYNIHGIMEYIAIRHFDQIQYKKQIIAPIKDIRIVDLSIGYDRIPIIFCDFITFNANMFHVLLGPNGIGKSTILNMLIGILPANCKGNIIFVDEQNNIYKLEEISRVSLFEHIAMITPNIKLPENKSIFEIFQIYNENITSAQIFQLLRKVQLSTHFIKSDNPSLDLLDATFSQQFKASTLSGGQYHRFLIALGLAAETEILLLDEALDSTSWSVAERILSDILSSPINLGALNRIRSVILITHHWSQDFFKFPNLSAKTIDNDGKLLSGIGSIMQ